MSEENLDLPENNPQESEEAEHKELLNEFARTNEDISYVFSIIGKAREELKKVIVGQDELINLLIAGLLSNGHVLLEGVPGIAKTLTVKLLAHTLDVEHARY